MRLRHPLVGLGIAALLTPAAVLAAWQPAVRLSPSGTALYATPDAAVGAGGRAVAAWVRRTGDDPAAGRIEVAARDGARARWRAPRALSGDGARSPRAALGARGDAAVAWVSGRTIVVAVRGGTRGGWAMSRAAAASGAVQDLRLAIDRSGRPVVLWSEARGGGFLVRLASRASAKAGWSVRPAQVATPGPAPPALALSPGAGAMAAWSEDDRARVSRTVGGAFEPPVEVSPERSGAPGVALSPGGASLAAWAAGLPGGTSVVIGSARGGPRMGWGTRDDLGIGTSPVAALDDRGDAVVAWNLGEAGTPQGIEAATRRGGGAWEASTVVPRRTCRCVLRVGEAAIDGTGTALVGWRRDDGAGAGGGGAAALAAGGGEWSRAGVEPDGLREAPAVAAGPGAGGLAVWAQDGPGGGVRAADALP